MDVLLSSRGGDHRRHPAAKTADVIPRLDCGIYLDNLDTALSRGMTDPMLSRSNRICFFIQGVLRMKTMLLIVIWIISALELAACSTTNSQWTGGFFGGYVNFSVTPLGPKKYMLEADASASVKRDSLIKAYAARAKKLCLPQSYTAKYSIEPYKYSSSVLYSYVALKITGLVWCQ